MQIMVIIAATIATFFWVYLNYKYKDSFDTVMDGIKQDEYPMSELFYIGFGFMQLINYDMEKKSSKNRIKDISEIYGKKYATYYYYVLTGAKISYIITFTPIVLLLTALTQTTILLLFGAVVTGMLIWYLDELINDKVMERHDELLKAYPQMLSKLTLLVNSGMPIRDAWAKVADSNTGLLYKEMHQTEEELINGIQEIDAYKAFGERCSIKPLKKFSSMMIQNLQKGSSEVVAFLHDMSSEAWEEKKHLVKRKGEKASTKLLFPITLIFVGILVIIMVPMLGGLT